MRITSSTLIWVCQFQLLFSKKKMKWCLCDFCYVYSMPTEFLIFRKPHYIFFFFFFGEKQTNPLALRYCEITEVFFLSGGWKWAHMWIKMKWNLTYVILYDVSREKMREVGQNRRNDLIIEFLWNHAVLSVIRFIKKSALMLIIKMNLWS